MKRKMDKIPSKDKRYLAYVLILAASIVKTLLPLLELLMGLSFDLSSFLKTIEVSNEDLIIAFEDVPAKLGTLIIVYGVILVIAESYIRDKEKNSETLT